VRVAPPYTIAIVLTSFDMGGTEHQTVELARRLDPSLFHVHLACFHRRGPLLARVPASVPIESFPLRGFRRPGALCQSWRFARWCRAIRARLVHSCDLYANVFALPAAALGRVKARVGSRREVITGDKSAAQLAAQRLAYGTAALVVANSQAAVRQLLAEGVSPRRIRLVPNGVDLPAFGAPRVKRELRRVVTVANLRPEKGLDTLLDAVPHVLAAHPEAEFVVAGDGPVAPALAAQARARGVADRVAFLGRCDDVPALLAASDIFVLPSRSEALPNAVIEAMAAGLPVVASRVGGIPELITPGTNGQLVPPDDPRALSAAIVELMDHPSFAQALGQASRARTEREFSFDRMVNRVTSLYLSLIERQPHVTALGPAVG
jgi:glycosyltransferase involved in cell wall biosynthesis